MQELLEELVMRRARFRCEYCLLPMAESYQNFEIDHIIAKNHEGPTLLPNLALACFACNNRKGPCIASIDPQTKRIVRLFHPRKDRWDKHFAWEGLILTGLTAVGRTTAYFLHLNSPARREIREDLRALGHFPPND